MILFAIATMTPMLLVLAGAVLGGGWVYAGLVYMTALVAGMDRLVARDMGNAAPGAEFPAARALLWVLGIGHFVVLAGVLCGLVTGGASGLGKLALGLAAGLIFGQISHPVAHELIHQPGRGARLLGRLIYSSLLIGHHASAHLRVHHIHVGSEADPNTPRLGRGFYRYALIASLGSFRAGFAAESAMLRRAGHPFWRASLSALWGGGDCDAPCGLGDVGAGRAADLSGAVPACTYADLYVGLCAALRVAPRARWAGQARTRGAAARVEQPALV